jgi:hypothetical protein
MRALNTASIYRVALPSNLYGPNDYSLPWHRRGDRVKVH